ncbi:MAG: glycosyltransferase family 39 protein, partial [Candidatus Omnitrophica bacterium]|nr:glycosyltransferase family 39 protein [Candidatus Omnitrophota bacterium]
MKENEYLSMAEEMQRTGDFTTRRIYFHNAFAENPDMQIFPQVPLVTYQILASWNLFGQNLWGARLFNVLFGVCSILTIYFLGLILFQSFRLALFCSFLLAIMPLGVFFSRNLQPESPGFLFMLLAHLFYLRYVTMSRRTDLFLGGTFFSLSWIYKMNFAFSALFFLFIFPYGKFFSRSRGLVKNIFALTLSYVPVLLSIAWLAHLGQWKFMQQTTIARVNLLEIFSPTYWNKYGKIIWWYIQGENFSLIFTILAVLGLFAAFLKRRSVLDRYLIGGVVSILCYSMFFSDFINQHNYYQMPFLGWVCISSTYGLLYISQLAKRAARKDVLGYLLSLVVFVSI